MYIYQNIKEVTHENSRKITKNKVGLLNLAEQLGNVSRACKVMGFSRDTFYRYKSAFEQGGVEVLLETSKRKPNIRNRTCHPFLKPSQRPFSLITSKTSIAPPFFNTPSSISSRQSLNFNPAESLKYSTKPIIISSASLLVFPLSITPK